MEVQEYVDVDATCEEDFFAIKCLNLLDAIHGFLELKIIRREVPIFGFIHNTFFMGTIDELRVDPDTMEIEQVELKTRSRQRIPPDSLLDTHKLQVMMYKKLFDDLVMNRVKKQDVANCVKVDLHKRLGSAFLRAARFPGVFTLDNLLDKLFDLFQSMTTIHRSFIDYTYQKDKETFAIHEVVYDSDWLHDTVKHLLTYWYGHREPLGVDIEDLWKCGWCEFKGI